MCALRAAVRPGSWLFRVVRGCGAPRAAPPLPPCPERALAAFRGGLGGPEGRGGGGRGPHAGGRRSRTGGKEEAEEAEEEELLRRDPLLPAGAQRVCLLHPDVKWGPGKPQGTREKIRGSPGITAVFLNVERMAAPTKKELEAAWGVRVFDRFTVVLHIFRCNARTKEARLQVALAELPLLRSCLKNHVAHLGGRGRDSRNIMGSGESFLQVQQRLLKDKEAKIRKALDRLRRKRLLLGQQRRRREIPVVSVVGYTNCGKTTLIKALTGDIAIQPRDQLFATLDVTAHAGWLPSRVTVIYMDTIGFLSQLPHSLVESSATLEDVRHSDRTPTLRGGLTGARRGGERGGAPTGSGARPGPAPAPPALGGRLDHPRQRKSTSPGCAVPDWPPGPARAHQSGVCEHVTRAANGQLHESTLPRPRPWRRSACGMCALRAAVRPGSWLFRVVRGCGAPRAAPPLPPCPERALAAFRGGLGGPEGRGGGGRGPHAGGRRSRTGGKEEAEEAEEEELLRRDPLLPAGAQRVCLLHPDVKWGPGKPQGTREKIRGSPGITAVFLNVERMAAPTKKELEAAWGVRVFDRFTVVLHIFRCNARTKEARLQVALAELPLLRSCLKNHVAHLGGRGRDSRNIMGSGESFLQVQQRLLKDKEAKIRKALDRLRRKRLLLGQQRRRREIPVVSVVGYTNCGKTTLIKALTGDIAIQPRDQLFATLDVTAHAGWLPSRVTVIYMDTIGFLSQLPHSLVESSATLEDVRHSDRTPTLRGGLTGARRGGERGGAPTGSGARPGPAPAPPALGGRLDHPRQRKSTSPGCAVPDWPPGPARAHQSGVCEHVTRAANGQLHESTLPRPRPWRRSACGMCALRAAVRPGSWLFRVVRGCGAPRAAPPLPPCPERALAAFRGGLGGPEGRGGGGRGPHAGGRRSRTGGKEEAEEAEEEELLRRDPLLPAGAQRVCLLHPDVKWGPGKPQGTRVEWQVVEAQALVHTLDGWSVVDTMVVPTKTPDRKLVFGRGTLERLTEKIRGSPEITAVFLNVERMAAPTKKELEAAWGVRVFDRFTVVLHIFRCNARTEEARLQVALAELPLLRSCLKNHVAHLGGRGRDSRNIMGSGESFLQVQQRLLKDKEAKIRKALDRLRRKRLLLGQQRRRREIPVVSVVGYTNCGKISRGRKSRRPLLAASSEGGVSSNCQSIQKDHVDQGAYRGHRHPAPGPAVCYAGHHSARGVAALPGDRHLRGHHWLPLPAAPQPGRVLLGDPGGRAPLGSDRPRARREPPRDRATEGQRPVGPAGPAAAAPAAGLHGGSAQQGGPGARVQTRRTRRGGRVCAPGARAGGAESQAGGSSSESHGQTGPHAASGAGGAAAELAASGGHGAGGGREA
ncbi:uncharacterized protein LOC132482366 isoform X3 [Mesoplodon densirostris]|uniref:uncharacterized protein LOC132482366 isoform X3 n=1 Tax=Mesoplodon densirostris TaxID=48708 RepID=UPI0028DBE0C4|nr:uncharacterized protein LOC132482366 isoform X3 [Mesoplodon densirostris]